MVKEQRKVMAACPECKVPGSDGRMPIVGFNAPIRSYRSEERGLSAEFVSNDFIQERYMQMIKDCGINLITHFENDYTKYPEDFHKVMQWADKYGVRVFVNDEALTADMSEEELNTRIAEYGKYKSFAGFRVVDEPCNENFPVSFEGEMKLGFRPMKDYAPIAKRLNSYDNLIGYMNLLPHYFWMKCTLEDYRNYIEEHLETCKPKVLSYDHYPFDDRDKERAMKWFFYNLAVIREYAKKNEIPFWSYVKCGSQWNFIPEPKESDVYSPTKQEFFWNVNVMLAFGCKGIEYYPLVQPYTDAMYLDGGLDCDRLGILGADGEPTMWHGFVRQVNNQIRAVDSVLMQCDSAGVIALKDAETYVKGLNGVIEAEGYKELRSVKCRKAGVFAGCFDYMGKTAFYVVNNDVKKCQNVTLQFDTVHQLRFASYARQGEENTDNLKLTIGAGSAMLVIVSE